MSQQPQLTQPLTIPKSIRRLTGTAISDFEMIKQGDKILIGLSGGKDSLSLLHVLMHFQRHAPINFSIGAMTVDPQSDDFDPSPLVPYLKSLGVDYFYVKEPILELAESHMQGDSYCSFCSRIKRGLMYKTARNEGYNVLALGQHLDDLAESFLMSAFHGGSLNTMKAHYLNDEGDCRIIRPFVYVREKALAKFATEENLPVIFENCPACFSKPTQREHMKRLLAEQEALIPNIFGSLTTTLKPLMAEGLPNEKT